MLEEGSRDRAVAVELLDLLDVDHPAQRLLDKEEELLPGSVLDYQGDVRIRRYVQLWLSYRIAGE
ncbi:hypothetical protein AL066_14810 [Pseudomonas nunensis]|nr:hypothetical protein AL066_14810 [Pseudomonas nunensis]